MYLAYYLHWKDTEDPGLKLAVFSTGPAVRNYGWNLVTEIIGTFVLVFGIFALLGNSGIINSGVGGEGILFVGLLVVGIGMSLGGPTGYAINPARDLGPRIIHAILPIPGKGTSDWAYSWVPVVGPLIGGLLGGILHHALFPIARRLQPMAKYVAAIDQGTTSTRCMVFDHSGQVVSVDQKEHEQIFPQPGWVEHYADGDLGTHAGGRQGRPEQGRPDDRRPGCGRHHQPARDDGGVGSQDRHPRPQRDRLAGHAHRPHLRRAGRATAARTGSGRRSACRWRPTSRARRSSGSSTTSPACRERAAERRHRVRQHRHLGGLEPDRRHRRRRPRHRPDQRVADDADGPAHARLGRRDPRHDGRSRGRCCPRSSRRAWRTARPRACSTASPWRASWATSRRRCSARPASRPARPRTPTAPATSCCSTPAPRRCSRRTAC